MLHLCWAGVVVVLRSPALEIQRPLAFLAPRPYCHVSSFFSQPHLQDIMSSERVYLFRENRTNALIKFGLARDLQLLLIGSRTAWLLNSEKR
jgi:hypothetical protein